MKIAIASPPFPTTIADGLYWVDNLTAVAAAAQASIICFPESYLPGYPGMGLQPETRSPEKLSSALVEVQAIAAKLGVAIIIPMDWYHPTGLLNLAFVVAKNGELLGYQTKNQLDPSEDNVWVPGTERTIFDIEDLRFGITICHEGFRYPESVRWAARQGASIVFHPHCTGSETQGPLLRAWGDATNPYYEKAMMMRAMENTIYFASANYAFKYPESASSVIAPDGTCVAYQAYGEHGVITATLNLELATGLLAKRFRQDLYKA